MYRLILVCVALIFFLAETSTSFVFAFDDKSVEGEKMNLKELLRAFGYDIKISGGLGNSRSAPIIIETSHPAEASLTEMLVLSGIGEARGVLWKTLARTQMKHEGMSLEQVKIEMKTVNDTEIITERANHYFDVGHASPDGRPLPTAIGYRHSKTGIVLPYEIGWLHFQSVADNESAAPGLGQTIAYGAPGIKATVYIYDKGRTDIPKDVSASLVKNEFKSAVSEMIIVNPKAKALGDPSDNGALIQQKFMIDQDFSIVALGVKAGSFIKLRITFLQDPLLVDLVNQSLVDFQAVLAGRGAQAGPQK